MLKTDTEKGTGGDDPDLKARQNAFGSNTYPRKKGRSFLVCKWFSYIYMAVALSLWGAHSMFCCCYSVFCVGRLQRFDTHHPHGRSCCFTCLGHSDRGLYCIFSSSLPCVSIGLGQASFLVMFEYCDFLVHLPSLQISNILLIISTICSAAYC